MDAPSSAPDTSAQRSGVLDDLRSLARELRGLVHDHLALAGLEARRAGESLVWMVILGVMVGGLLLSAWLGLLAAGVLMLIERGVMSGPGTVLLAVGANLLLALILGWAICRQRPHLQFPATVRSLSSATEKSS